MERLNLIVRPLLLLLSHFLSISRAPHKVSQSPVHGGGGTEHEHEKEESQIVKWKWGGRADETRVNGKATTGKDIIRTIRISL